MSAFARALADRLVQRGHRTAEATATAIDETIARAHPGLPAPDATLAEYLAERLREVAAEGDAATAVERLELADLYLAWACGRGDDAAIRAFERLYFGAARVALARMQLDASGIDEVLQMVREKLFVTADGAPAKVLALAGRGNLGTLVRVTAVRLALNLQRDARLAPDDTSDDDVVAALSSETDPQRQVIAQHERAALKQAIEAAVRGLEPRQRNLVRMHLLHRLSIDEISALYRVSRATAARWLAQARADIERGTRRYLHEQLALAPSGIDSMLKVVQQSLEVSFERILAP
ncbi:MAG: sigma-70 family RNA polymerase sigma factor [Deltaproteobacteria bacterium]|nr:sigma-70 family RNA polymerase sigma factor [Deltaproteobacteria bacterium]